MKWKVAGTTIGLALLLIAGCSKQDGGAPGATSADPAKPGNDVAAQAKQAISTAAAEAKQTAEKMVADTRQAAADAKSRAEAAVAAAKSQAQGLIDKPSRS